MTRHKVIVALLAGLTAASLGGCLGQPVGGYPDGVGPPVRGVVSADGVSCGAPESMSAAATQTLPVEFVPVSASRCVLGIETVAGDGEWYLLREQEARGDLSELTSELRRPDEKATGDVACPAIAVGQTVITLVDIAGRSIVPSIPQTACHTAIPSVLTAIRALPWQTVHTSKVRQLRTELDVSSNCSKIVKPMTDITALDRRPQSTVTTSLVFPVTPSALQVCRYDLDPNDVFTDRGARLMMGVLVGAAILKGQALTEAVAAMNAAPPAIAGACTLPQAPFAVLYPADGPGGPFVTVELGGCHRMVEDSSLHLRQLDPSFTLPG